MKNIGYFVPEFPGQTHVFFWREVSALERTGLRVTLFSTRLPPERLIVHGWSATAIERTSYLWPLSVSDFSRAAGRLGGIRRALASAFAAEGSAILPEALKFLPFAIRLNRLCAEKGVEHVHVGSCGRSALISALARAIGGPSYSLTLHNPLAVFGRFQKFKWSGAAFATVITETLRCEVERELRDVLPQRLVVQSMGVDSLRFTRTTPYAPHSTGEPLRLFSCARLNPAKGHLYTIRAVGLLRARGIPVHLEIAGEDDHGGQGFRREVEHEIDRLKLKDAVKLLGAINEGTVLAKLNESHIFVLASDSEPLGVAYMEAMCCSVPTIGTGAGGVPELIDADVDGVLVPPKSPEAIAAAVERIAGDRELALRLGEAGCRKVKERFDASRGAETLVTLLRATRDSR